MSIVTKTEPHQQSRVKRVVAQRGPRTILLDPTEIRYAEAERNLVWLHTDRGRLRAVDRGLSHLADSLDPDRFFRVHRRYLVNLDRVREVERGFNGELLLVVDPREPGLVPVARARVAEFRARIGL